MNRSDVIQLLKNSRKELDKFSVKTLSVFGSVARNEANPGSDVDILVGFHGPATFDGYMDLKFFLEDLFGCPVDLVTEKALKPRLRSHVEKEMVRVA